MSLKTKLAMSLNEKDVENAYRAELVKALEGSTITSPYKVDGLLETKNIRSLLEFKYNDNLKTKLSQCNILIQCLYYLKKFEIAGDRLPSTIFVGDMNECFALHTNAVVKYLAHEIDWKTAPSNAHKVNPAMIQAMVEDTDILPFVFDVDATFSMKEVLTKIKDLSDNVQRKVRVTKHNVVSIFDYFEKHVLDKVTLTTNEKANLFIQIIVNSGENCLHPKRKNTLMTKSFGEVKVNGTQFKSFFQHFEGDIYSPKEKEGFTSLVDRLVEDSVRRNKGEFFTPTPFVDLAHKYVSDTFGEAWKDKYVVWDCACGTGNLTRDYKFKELYLSTLEQSDLQTMEQMGYNPEATKFQYDFLNDTDDKLPQGLRDAIAQGKEILFLINPPYATAGNMSNDASAYKAGVSDTFVGAAMRKENWGACTQNIYAQFFYRIYKYQQLSNNIKIGIFCKPNYLSSPTYKDFRKNFFSSFSYKSGFLFQASHFADVSAAWGINFAVFGNEKGENTTDFKHDLVDYNDTYELTVIGEKCIYNLDTEVKASDWIRTEVKGLKTFDVPQLSSACNVKPKGFAPLVEGSLGYFYTDSNSVRQNLQCVGMFSSGLSRGHGISVIKNNYLKTATFFSARKLIQGNWINDKDEYLAPNEQHPDYAQFTNDSVVYSLFNNSSQQSSLRQVDYKGKKWDIKNEFFWMSKAEMQLLANAAGYDALYKDAKKGADRHVYSLISGGLVLSADAQKVLDMATDLLKKSIVMRKAVSEEHPEYHLDSFDAGHAQLKLVYKQYFAEEYKEFRKAYKELEDRMRPLVYELGFLKA